MDTKVAKTPKQVAYRFIKIFLILIPVTYFYWPLVAVYIATGLYDVFRQKNKNLYFVFMQYFTENGLLAWIFSPINTAIDILSLPFINKQVYQLKDLPKKHQEEIQTLIDETPNHELSIAMNELAKNSRSMMFYKWYGQNVKATFPCELYHRNFKTILTIGVSNFKSKAQTRAHFGWLRAGIRVLINIDNAVDERAYIDVNNERHIWKKNGPLFIFDDTVVHQSVNDSNQDRNCLFIDVVRPSYLPFIIGGFVKMLGFASVRIPGFNKLSRWEAV